MTLSTILPLISAVTCLPLTVYCCVLSRRLRRLNNLETGLGGAIAVMTSEISRLEQAIRSARAEAEQATNELLKAIESARNEKAYWTLQRELMKPNQQAARRLRPRRAVQEKSNA